MKKSYWSGFLCGVLCTVVFAFIGVTAFQFAINHASQDEISIQSTREYKL